MNSITSRRVAATTVSILALLVLTACGSNSATPSAAASTPSAAASTTTAGGEIVGVTVTGDKGKAPTITVAKDAPKPPALQIMDISVGDGAEVKATDTVTAHYTGVSLTTGQVFDSSWTKGQPAQFPLSGVIPGWQQGVPGMTVGGRRLLVIPAALAYGESPPDGYPAGALAFVIDLVSVP